MTNYDPVSEGRGLFVGLDISRTDVEKCIQEVGIGFLFAPLFHGIMRHVEDMRKEMGIRTIFNLIGPLANPANSSHHVLGVYEPGLTEKMARVMIQCRRINLHLT